jgi:acyl carrier protein
MQGPKHSHEELARAPLRGASRKIAAVSRSATPGPTLEALAEIASRHLGWQGRLAPEMRLVEDLGLDSLGLLTLAAEVENHFQICLSPEDEAAIETVGDLLRSVAGKLEEPRGV